MSAATANAFVLVAIGLVFVVLVRGSRQHGAGRQFQHVATA